MKVDLHCHTTASDGSLSPKEIIDLAVKHEVELLAITDHDTTAGFETAREYAAQQKLNLISGAEISCQWHGHTIHIVGLDFDIENSTLQNGLKEIRRLRKARAQQIIDKLQSRPNINVTQMNEKLASLVGDGVVGRGHVATLLQQEGLVKNSQQAFDKFLKKGRVGYVGCEWPPLNKVVEWITGAGGVAVIAHPKIYRFTSNKLNRLITDFIACGGRAIEVVNQPRHGADIDAMAERALKHDLLASVGSDFHRPEHTWRGLGWLAPLPQKSAPVWSLFS